MTTYDVVSVFDGEWKRPVLVDRAIAQEIDLLEEDLFLRGLL